MNFLLIRENGPYSVQANLEIEGQSPMFRATLCRCGKSRNKPFCDNSHIAGGFIATGEPESQQSEPLPKRNGGLHVTPSVDGPLVLDLSELKSADQAAVERLRELASEGAERRGASRYVQMLLDANS